MFCWPCNVIFYDFSKVKSTEKLRKVAVFKAQHPGQYNARSLAYGSNAGVWTDIYLMKNDKEIIGESHGILLDVNEPSNFPYSNYLGYSARIELESGDTLTIG